MNIIILKGVFPLNKKITLSKSKVFGIELDNPRSRNEIDYVIDFLKKRIDFKKDKKLLSYFLVGDTNAVLHLNELKKILKSLQKNYKGNNLFNRNFLKGFNEKKYFDFLAKSWLIVRYDDKGFFKNLRHTDRKLKKKIGRGVFILKGTEIGIQREERTLKYISIIDLLFIDTFNGSLSKTIILEDNISSLHRWLFVYLTAIPHGRLIHKEFDYFSIVDRLNQIIKIVQKIDKLSQDQQEKILFVGETIRSVNRQNRDAKMQFLMLISIIEFLLTRNPDTSRFNVEDSIRKQFQLKASIVVCDKKKELNLIIQKMKIMYDVRSMIAHGNFSDLEKFVKKQKKKDKNFNIFNLVEEVFCYVGIIVMAYIDEPDYIESLKKL